ncbi:hypothetical protein GCM10011588_66580 [Nocardia jinanensis]|uniref:Uncharacterized protein n=1 Tax=Nocardia jinanensis TaxID=382504 RepID=A0A917RXP8_9NOCA|nr:hypothetical protein GCM10011588_66580 [Nocardia jinanensis]
MRGGLRYRPRAGTSRDLGVRGPGAVEKIESYRPGQVAVRREVDLATPPTPRRRSIRYPAKTLAAHPRLPHLALRCLPFSGNGTAPGRGGPDIRLPLVAPWIG